MSRQFPRLMLCIGKELLITVRLVRKDISISIAIRLRVRRRTNWSSIPYSGQRHFSSSRLSDRIWDPPSPMDSGKTLIYFNMAVREAKTSSQFTVEMKSAWRLTATTH